MRRAIASITVIAMCLCVLPAAACNDEPQEIKNPGSYVLAVAADIATLDPAYAYDTPSTGQIQNIYDTLIEFDDDSPNEFAPSLATEWTVSEDGRTYRFRIREDVSFHNGDPLTPEDVEYSFERGMVQDYALGPQWMLFEPLFGLGIYSSRTEIGLIPLEEIRSKVEVDGQWVQFNLATPYEPFLQILASSWGSIVDMDWCIERGDWDGTEESYQALNNPVLGGSPLHSQANGTGPFRLERWTAGTEIVLVRNDDYWAPPASFERVISRVIPDWGQRGPLLYLGDVDVAWVPNEEIQEVRNMPGIRAYEGLLTLQNQALFFQFDIDPTSLFIGSGQLDGNGIPVDFFTDIDVRKGFAYAFDWDTYINEGMRGLAEKISSPMVRGIPYFRADWPAYELDLAKAEDHLRAAWDGLLWENGFEMTIVYAAGDSPAETACETLQSGLLQINPSFRMSIQPMPMPDMMNEMWLGGLPMYAVGWTADFADPHNFVFPYMHSQGLFAQAQRYSSETADGLIEQAISSTDHSERQGLYDQIAGLYYDEVPSIMLCQVTIVHVFRDWIQGFNYNPIRPVCEMYAYYLSKGYE